jgi:hypothetical protein
VTDSARDMPNIDPRYHPDLIRHMMEHGAAYCRACDLAKDILLKEGSTSND